MKKTIIILLIIGFNSNIFSQTNYFNNYYNFGTPFSWLLNLYPANNGYIGSGIICDSVYWKNNIALSKLDSVGSLKGFKEIKLDSCSYYNGDWGGGGFAKCSNGDFILGGDIVSDTSNGNVQYIQHFLMRFNNNLDTLWTKNIDFGTFWESGITQCKETTDHGFIMCGEALISSTISVVLFVKTDSIGNTLWVKTYNLYGNNGDQFDKAWNVTETPDRGFLLGCSTYSVPSMGIYQGSGDGIVIKTDSIGNWLWSKNMGGFEKDWIAEVTVCRDSNYLIATVYSYYTAPYNDFWRGKLRLMKITPSNTVIWDRQYEPEITSLTAIKIMELNNGDIVVGGTKRHQISEFKSYDDSYLFKLNSNGDSIWYREYAKSTDTNLVTWNNLYNFEQTPDGGFVACGKYFVNTQIPVSSWIFKTDSIGCLQPGCQYVGVEELQKAKVGELNVYPNPANEYFIINYVIEEEIKQATAEIYDVLGKKINTINITSKADQQLIKCADYINGQYYIVLKNNNKILKTFKFNVTH